MHINIIITLCLLLISVAFLLVINNAGKEKTPSTPVCPTCDDDRPTTGNARSVEPITVTAPPSKTGVIPTKGGTITHIFTVKNTGTSSINVNFAASSQCGWTITATTPTALNLSGGRETTVYVTVEIPYGTSSADIPLNGTNDTVIFYANSTTPSFSVTNQTATVIGRLSRVAVNFVSIEGSREPNGTALLTYDVTNTGNALDAYNMTINVQEPTTRRIWESGLIGTGNKLVSGLDKYIDAGLKAQIKAQVKIPQSVYGDIISAGTFATATLTARSNFGGGIGTGDTQIAVDNAYGVDLQLLSNATIRMSQGDTARYQLKVANTRNFWNGNDTDVIKLQRSTPLTGWGAVFDKDSISIGRGESTIVEFRVTAPPDASIAPCIINVTAYPEKDATKNKTINITAQINQVYQLNIVGPINGTGIPGMKVSYNLRVDNVGNGPDKFRVDAATNHGWNVTDTMTKTEKEKGKRIESLNSSYVTVTVEIPNYDPAIPSPNTADILNITASSFEDGGKYYFLITTVVGKGYGVSLSPANTSKYVSPGYPVQYVISVTNTGNTIDNITLEAVSAYHNGAFIDGNRFQSTGWNITQDVSRVTTERTTQNNPPKNVTITITPPLTAKKDEKLILNITATSEGNVSKKAYASVVAIVAQTVGVSIRLVTPVVYGEPGNTTTITFDVKNEGNGDDNFTIGFLLNDTTKNWQVPSNMTTPFKLSAGANQTKQVSFTIPRDPLPSANTERVLTINVTSLYGKALKSSIIYYKIAEVTIRASQIYGVSVSCNAKEKNLLPGGSAIYSITVKNTGNGDDIIALSTMLTDSTNWRAPLSTSVSLPMGESENVTVTIGSNEYGGKSWGTDWEKVSLGAVNVVGTTHGKVSSTSLTARIVPGVTDVQRKDADPGKKTEYSISVRNVWTTGQIDFSINTGKQLPGWIILPNGTVTIPAGTPQQTVTVSVTPPSTKVADGQTETITAILKLGNVAYMIPLDITVRLLDISVRTISYPSDLVEGKDVRINANINSQYTKTATDVSVKFYYDDNIISTVKIPTLGGKNNTDVPLDLKIPLIRWYEKSEEHTVKVEVDAMGGEQSTTNNIQSVSIFVVNNSLPIEVSLPILIVGIIIIGAALYVNRASLQKIKWYYPAIGIGTAMIAASLFNFMWDSGSSLMLTIIFILVMFPLITVISGISTKSYVIPPLTGCLQFITFFSIISFTAGGIERLPALLFEERYYDIAVIDSIPNIGYMILYIVIGLICGMLAIRLWFYAGKKLLILKATIDKIKHME